MADDLEGPEQSPKKSQWKRVWLRRLIAWGVTIAVLAFLLTRYSAADIGEAIAQGNWLALVGVILLATIWSILFMVLADWMLFREVLGPLRYLEVLRGKAGCSVLQALNHTVGQGAYAVWVGRKTKSSLSPTISAMGLLVATDLIALFVIVCAAVWSVDGLPQSELLRWLAPLGVVGLVGGVLLGPYLLPRLISRARILESWKNVRLKLLTLIVVTRIVAIGGVMTGTWLSAWVFGLDIPLSAFLAYLPIIFLAAALPVNVLGFGAVQLVWVASFEPWVSGAEILAFQFLAQAASIAAFLLRGAPFLPSVLRDIAPAE